MICIVCEFCTSQCRLPFDAWQVATHESGRSHERSKRRRELYVCVCVVGFLFPSLSVCVCGGGVACGTQDRQPTLPMRALFTQTRRMLLIRLHFTPSCLPPNSATGLSSLSSTAGCFFRQERKCGLDLHPWALKGIPLGTCEKITTPTPSNRYIWHKQYHLPWLRCGKQSGRGTYTE